MKRQGYLWQDIIKFNNLLQAAKQAQKSKRFNTNVLEFNENLERELITMQQQLQDKSYQFGEYKTFYIVEPKKRMISAAPYRDRVVHHALCNIIQPIFERSFIADSYANRVGYGTHRALKRFTQFARTHRYVLQCDIQKYFPNIDHEILKTLIRRKIKCPDTLCLVDTIIDHSNPQESPILYFPNDDLFSPLQRRKGLPMGNLTSQFFANVYLNGFDHFIQEKLKISSYVRYVDDFALFSNEKNTLVQARHALENYLIDLRLKIHPIKSQLFETRKGASFLGFRILPHTIRVKSENLRRAKRRLKQMQVAYEQGTLSLEEIKHSIQSWIAHLEYGNTWKLREKLLSHFNFCEKIIEGQAISPVARGFLEQQYK